MHSCDFSRSFLYFRIDTQVQPALTQSTKPNHTANTPRIQLECVCDLQFGDEDPVRYVLGASCKTERVNVESGIWNQPNADFCLTASDTNYLIIKRYDHTGRRVKLYPPSLGDQPHRQTGLIQDAYAEFKIHVHEAAARSLDSVQEIHQATMAGLPLVAQTEFETDDGYRVKLQYPVKTINIGDREMFYQTDTGPILYPQQPSTHAHPVESFMLAYIAANAPDWAELILNVETPVSDDISVSHYSQSLRLECQNRMFAVIDNS